MLKTIGAYAVSRIVSGLLLYFTLVALLYTLDKHNYEQFSAGYAAYQLVGTLLFGWIYAIIPHMIAGFEPEEQAQKQAELISAFAWMCVLTLVVFGAASATGALDLPALVLVCVAVASMTGSAGEQAVTIASAKEQPRLYLHITVTRHGAGLVLALAAAASALGASGAFLGLAAASLLALAVADRPIGLRAGGLRWIGPRRFASLLATGLPAIIAFAVYPIAISVNRLVIAESCSLEAAAALGAINDLVAGPALLVFSAINLALMPSLFAAANRGDARTFRWTLWRVVALQASMIIPAALFFFFFGDTVGSILRPASLPPVTADMLPYIAVAVLFSVIINTAAGVALACGRIRLATSYSLLTVGVSVFLILRENCDLLGIAKTLTLLMAISSLVGLISIYRLRNLPNRGVDPLLPVGGAG